MNILYVAHETSLGGATRSLIGIIEELSKKEDMNIYILIPKKKGELLEKIKSINKNIKILQYKYFFWNIPNSGKIRIFFQRILLLYNYLVAYIVYCKLRGKNIEIVHSNSSVVNIGYIVAKMLKCYHVWHFREFGKEDFNRNYVVSERVIRRQMINSSLLICVSKAIKEKYTRILNYNKNMVVIYNGVPVCINNEKKDKKKDENINFLIAGRVCEEKGQIVAIKAVEKLVLRDITNIHLYIAGKVEDTAFEKYVLKHGLNEYISFLGEISNMNKLRSMIDIELICSRCEAFGRITIEAMMCGHPVLGSDSGGTSELINNGTDGFLYEWGNDTELSNKMEYLIKNEKLRREMGEKAFWKANKYFSQQMCVERIFQTYIGLLSDRKPKGI